MKTNIIAVDFDGTLCVNKFPEIGYDEIDRAEYLVRKEQAYAKGVKEEDGDTND